MAVHGGHDVGNEGDELQVVHRCAAGREEHGTTVGAEAPVVVLARAVDALEGFLVEQHAEVVAACGLAHNRHQQQVVVVGKVCFLEDGSALKLVGRNLVVACLDGDAEAVALYFEVEHESLDARGDCTEVVVFELLVLRAFVAP